MDYQTKLESLHQEIVFALCSIGKIPEGLLPCYVFVEETDDSLVSGNTVFSMYNLIAIHENGMCLLENLGTGIEEQREIREICTHSLAELWSEYRHLSGEETDSNVNSLLYAMATIAKSLITGQYITDFTVHDTNFIRETKAKTPFVWFIYKSGTHIHQTDEKQEILQLKDRIAYYEKYSNADFLLYRYDGQKLFPVFPKVMHEWIENQLKIEN
jgi:hypothetical protein